MSRLSRPSTQLIEEIDETLPAAAPVLADSVADQLNAAATEQKVRVRRAAATQPPTPPEAEADEVSVVSSTSSKTRGCITTLAELSMEEQTERKMALAERNTIVADIISDCYVVDFKFTRDFDPNNLVIIKQTLAEMTKDELLEKLAKMLYADETEAFRTSTRKDKDPAHDGKRVIKKAPPMKKAAEPSVATPAPQATA